MMKHIAVQVGQALKTRGWMLTTAESCTGGAVAQVITDVSGSSGWFDRGFITYSNASKQQMLGVQEQTLIQHGAVSEAVVREMVEGALKNSDAQVALSISGIAGPTGGTAEKPVGTVWFAWGVKGGEVLSRRLHLDGERHSIRQQAVQVALNGVLELLVQQTEVA